VIVLGGLPEALKDLLSLGNLLGGQVERGGTHGGASLQSGQ
jgi:hypothetical protein